MNNCQKELKSNNKFDTGYANRTIYRDNNLIINENNLIFPKNTNKNHINQLYPRIYSGFYAGDGKLPYSPENIKIETILKQGISSNIKNIIVKDTMYPKNWYKAKRRDGLYEFEILHNCISPQKTQHIIPPKSWTRGGEPTRDYYRQITFV
jgi:hypothetical protein